MKKLFFLAFALYSGVALCTTVTIVNSGFTFSPDTVNITIGDSVKFAVASIHEPVEVSQATWNANGNTPLSGGFSLPFGGGLVLPAQLPVGTHWYVCSPHASMGMKGVIIVHNAAGIQENKLDATISIFPNPTSGAFNVQMSKLENVQIKIYDVLGELVYSSAHSHIGTSSNLQIDLSEAKNGIYFLQLKTSDGVATKKIIVNK